MARVIKPLNMQQVLALKPRGTSYYKAVDNDGLYVEVRKRNNFHLICLKSMYILNMLKTAIFTRSWQKMFWSDPSSVSR
jgi:hypothetical protein